jgi:hypothetical protein
MCRFYLFLLFLFFSILQKHFYPSNLATNVVLHLTLSIGKIKSTQKITAIQSTIFISFFYFIIQDCCSFYYEHFK